MNDPFGYTQMHSCPVCWRRVESTRHGVVEGHFDNGQQPCVASYQPFHITLTGRP